MSMVSWTEKLSLTFSLLENLVHRAALTAFDHGVLPARTSNSYRHVIFCQYASLGVGNDVL